MPGEGSSAGSTVTLANSSGRHTGLVDRLTARRDEIEQAILTRAYAVADPSPAADPEYRVGLRGAVSAALDYRLAAIGNEGARLESIPPALLAQVRHAARSGVSLDTVLRRCFAGYTLVGDFIVEEAKGAGRLADGDLQQILRGEAASFDRLVAAVTKEHTAEVQKHIRSPEHRRAEQVRRLLAGDLVDPRKLGYELDKWHLGLIAKGLEAESAIRELANSLGHRRLIVPAGDDIHWAWLGAGRRADQDELAALVASSRSDSVLMTFGEPAHGVSGWRLTHRQAAGAWPIALRGPDTRVRYADVALLASMLQDEVLTTSLESLFLAPLRGDWERSERGADLRRTLRAYFAAQRNVSSTAAALGVTRTTIRNRLRAIEERLARPLDTCAAEMEVALKFDSLPERRLN